MALTKVTGSVLGDTDSTDIDYTNSGTSAVERTLQSKLEETVSVKDFGAVCDGSTDDTAAIQAAIAYCWSLVEKVDDTLPGNFGWKTAAPTLEFSGTSLITDTLLLYSGFNYHLPSGASLIAGTNGMTMMRTATLAERGDNYYGVKSFRISGGGFFDGDHKATVGLQVDTGQGLIDITILRCSYRRATTTGSGSAASDQLTLASATDIQELDFIEIANEDGQYYNIIDITGSVATLDRDLTDTVTDEVVTVRAVGLAGLMIQATPIYGYFAYNDIGVAFGRNREGFGCTDMRTSGIINDNNIGMLQLNSVGNISFDETFAHSYGSELVLMDCVDCSFDTTYTESHNDSDIGSKIPPGLSVPMGKSALQATPMVDIKGGSGIKFYKPHWPMNGATTTWRRWINNSGNSTMVYDLGTTTGALSVNPSRPEVTGTTDGTTANKLVDSGASFLTDGVAFVGGRVLNTTDSTQALITAVADNELTLDGNIFVSGEDYTLPSDQAICEQQSAAGQITFERVYGALSLDGAILCVDETGAASDPADAEYSVRIGTREYKTGTNRKVYIPARYQIESAVYVEGDSYASLEVRGSGVRIGGGTAEPDQVLGVQQSAIADATDAASAITQLNSLLAACRTHGLIDT